MQSLWAPYRVSENTTPLVHVMTVKARVHCSVHMYTFYADRSAQRPRGLLSPTLCRANHHQLLCQRRCLISSSSLQCGRICDAIAEPQAPESRGPSSVGVKECSLFYTGGPPGEGTRRWPSCCSRRANLPNLTDF